MGWIVFFFSPASSSSLHIIQAVTEVISLGLATTVFPVATAGAIFQVRRYRGRFQGLIRPAVRKQESNYNLPLSLDLSHINTHTYTLTHSYRAAHSVIDAAHVVHLTAVSRVVLDG